MKRLLLFCALLLSACGEKPKVRIALVANSYTHLPVALADQLGYYKEEGVDVVLEPLPSVQKTTEGLLAGSAELASGAYSQVLQLAVAGRSIRSVIVILNRYAIAIVTSPSRRDIRTLSDLRGTNFGVTGLGSSNHQFAIHVFAQHGLTGANVSFVGVGLGPTLFAALDRGVVDAATVSGSDFARVRMRYPSAAVLAESFTPEGSRTIWNAVDMPAANLIAREEWIAPNRDKLRRIVRANKRALAWLQTHSPEEILAVLPEGYRSADTEVDLAGLRMMKPIYSPDGIMPPGGPEAVRKALSTTQETLRNAQIDLSKTYTNEFVLEKP